MSDERKISIDPEDPESRWDIPDDVYLRVALQAIAVGFVPESHQGQQDINYLAAVCGVTVDFMRLVTHRMSDEQALSNLDYMKPVNEPGWEPYIPSFVRVVKNADNHT